MCVIAPSIEIKNNNKSDILLRSVPVDDAFLMENVTAPERQHDLLILAVDLKAWLETDWTLNAHLYQKQQL